MEKIKIGILGYGNLGRGVELSVNNNLDMELVAVFTRRDNVKVANGLAINVKEILNYKDKIDVLVLCGGSATDLPVQGVEMLKDFNTVDSFDTHAKIPEFFASMDKVGKESNHLSAISIGWDPGLFSICRSLFESILPNATTYTFWGKGVSQGHSDAIRRIEGVVDGRQYTIPIDKAVEAVRSGEKPELTTREKHLRECFVVAEEGADLERIEKEIVTMPNYFSDYDTIVHFISEDEMKKNHSGIPHGGKVIRTGDSFSNNKHLIELGLTLDSNPEFTAGILVAYARAIYRMAKNGETGCKTVYDIPLGMLSPMSASDLRAKLL